MAKEILSDIILTDMPKQLNTAEIEKIIQADYGSIIRWAIAEVIDNKLKICLTYEKEA